jgi:signal transduction histidine kinase
MEPQQPTTPETPRLLEDPPPGQVERQLKGMLTVLNHDLSKQLVVVQGLAQLLQLEEAGRLSGEGREQLRRLTAAAQKALEMIKTLKSLGRVGSGFARIEQLTLVDLAAEVKAEAHQLWSIVVIEDHLSPTARPVAADRRFLHQALMELVRLAAGDGSAPATVELGSGPTAEGTELWVASDAGPSPGPALENRVEVLYARELAATWAGRVSIGSQPPRGTRFSLSFPAS